MICGHRNISTFYATEADLKKLRKQKVQLEFDCELSCV